MKRFTASAALLGAAMTACTPSLPVRSDAAESVIVEFVELGRPDVPARVSWLYDDYDCYGRYPEGGLSVGNPPVRSAVATTGKRFFTVEARYAPTATVAGAHCDVTYTFPIEAGGRYRVSLTTGPQECKTAVVRLPDNAAATEVAPTPVAVVKRELLATAAAGDGPGCKADPAYAGSSRLTTPRGR